MKYLLFFLISIASHSSFASYHENEGSSGSGGGSYGGGSSALAVVGVGVLAYFLLRNKEDEEAKESDLRFNFSNEESKFKIDFKKDDLNLLNKRYSESEIPTTEFQINLRYQLK